MDNEKRQYPHTVLIGVLFDKKYKFEDIILIGESDSPIKTFALQHDEIMRLYEDFCDDNGNNRPVEYSESRSMFDDAICVIKYCDGYEHIYCFHPDDQNNARFEWINKKGEE